jgi:hypothetical protein
MGQFHDRMAEDLKLRNYSPATSRNYLLYARHFVKFYMRSPDQLGKPRFDAICCTHSTPTNCVVILRVENGQPSLADRQ